MTMILAQGRVRRDEVWELAESTDEDLLGRYLSGVEPGSQEAFRELVVRHGPMVLGVCRHVLGQVQDAEDAFQATFLALARRGATIRDRRVLSGWLHEVAYRIAIRSRASMVRRRAMEIQGTAMSSAGNPPSDPLEHAAWNELRPVLHEEVNQLPPKYRLPVILSYLEGRTNEEVAALLNWPVGTVKGRLSRARELLRSRLRRRGLGLSAAFLMTARHRGLVFAEVVPPDLVKKTVRRAIVARAAAVVSDSPAGCVAGPGDGPPDAEPPSASAGGRTGIVRLALLAVVLLVPFLSLAIGGSLAATGRGWSLSELRSFWIAELRSQRAAPTMGSLPPAAPERDRCH